VNHSERDWSLSKNELKILFKALKTKEGKKILFNEAYRNRYGADPDKQAKLVARRLRAKILNQCIYK
jgi:hypothetical protein